MGSKITASHVDARLLRGTGSAGTLFASTWLGILVSTTAHFSGRSLGWSGTKDFFSALDRKQYCGGLDHCNPATATIAATCYGLTWLMAATRCREESASPLEIFFVGQSTAPPNAKTSRIELQFVPL